MGLAQAGVITDSYNFNDNQLPAGWSLSFGNTPSRNAAIRNQRFDVGQVDTYAEISKSYVIPLGTTQLEISYTANLANVFWGMGNRAHLYDSTGSLLAATDLWKQGFGLNTMLVGVGAGNGIQFQAGYGAQYQYGSELALTPNYGTYFVDSIFRDGQIQQTVSKTDGSVSFTTGFVSTPSFLLSDVSKIGIHGATTTGASAWIDDLLIQATVVSTPTPSTLTLANLSNDVYDAPNSQGSDGYSYVDGIVGFGSDGFAANAYKNGDQIAIAVRGTDLNDLGNAAYNLVADTSFAGNQPNQTFTDNVETLITLVQRVHLAYPNAEITLTGHSLGGAVAQVVGKAANIAVTSFDAPGPGNLYQSLESQLLPLSALNIPSSSDVISNYRLYGDQISLIGSQLGSTITVPNTLTNAQVDQNLLPMGWYSNHDRHTLANQISTFCPSGASTSACTMGASGLNIGSKLVTGAQVACSSSVTKCVQAKAMLLAVEAFVNKAFDPGPGWGYTLQLAAGSPFINSVQLPLFGVVSGWELLYHDQFGWSSGQILMSEQDFQFLTDVDGLIFTPLNAFGDPIFNPDSFAYGISFASDGFVNATQITLGTVPEPSSILLFGISGIALLVVVRRRNRKLFH